MKVLLKKPDNKFIQQRTRSVVASSARQFDQMYHMRGNRGRRVKLSPYVAYERAK